MKQFLSLILFFASFTGLTAQDCVFYYPHTEGKQLQYTRYDNRDRVTGSSIQKITSVVTGANSTEITAEMETFDSRDRSQGTATFTLKCEDGIFYLDMKNYLGSDAMESFEDMEVSIDGGNLQIPQNLKAGDMLEGGQMNIGISSEGMTVMNMNVNISNRKVEAVETITTPAGSYECYKITYDIDTKMIFNIKAKGCEWYAKDIGVVRSESYDARGNLSAYTLLTEIK